MKHVIIGLFIILLIGSVYFCLERILFSDASYILFRIINLDSLQIQELRYGSFITQIFPLITSRLHLPLGAIVLLYSMSFNLFYLIIAFLLAYRFKEISMALLMGFYYVLFVSDTYFWTNNEVNQGIAWMFLFFGTLLWLDRRKASMALMFPVFTALAFLALFTHPLVAFPTLFLWLFFLVQKKFSFNGTWNIIFLITLVIICIARFLYSTGSDSHYDVDRLQTITNLSLKRAIDAFTSPMAKEIFKRSGWNYWIIPLLFLAGLFTAFKQKWYKPIMLVIGFSVCYFMAVCITFDDFTPFYTESELMPLSIIVSAPFVYYTLPRLNPKMAVWVVALIFLIRLSYIGKASEKWVERKEWIMATLQDMRKKNIKKAIIYENAANKKTLIMNWGAPTESIIASALAKENPQLSFVVGSPENLKQRNTADSSQMISCFENYTNQSMNRRYFTFDSTKQYQILER